MARRIAPSTLLWLTMGSSLAGCGGSGSNPTGKGQIELKDYTVSYRSLVRVPADGVVMKEQAFADQVSRLDSIAAKRCPDRGRYPPAELDVPWTQRGSRRL